MGLFKDFREDFSQASKSAGEPDLRKQERPIPMPEMPDSLEVDTIGEDVDVKSELSKLDGLLEQVKEPSGRMTSAVSTNNSRGTQSRPREDRRALGDDMSITKAVDQAVAQRAIEDETSVITASTVLTGDIQTAGSFDIQGTINGNVSCYGKLVVTGTINGNSSASEFFADVASIEGEVVSTGTVKVGAGSVIVGNITASSAVIAGAVKGDIDVQGPVVVDTSAVIMGNIKSRSVQINNGAVIEGFCSQCYADVDVQSIFDRK